MVTLRVYDWSGAFSAFTLETLPFHSLNPLKWPYTMYRMNKTIFGQVAINDKILGYDTKMWDNVSNFRSMHMKIQNPAFKKKSHMADNSLT